MPLNPTAKRKPAREWTVLGTLGAARRHAGDGHRAVRVRAQRSRRRHGARPRRPAARRSGATLVSVDERSVAGLPGFDQGRREERLRRRRLREAVAGDSGRAGAEGDVDARHRRCRRRPRSTITCGGSRRATRSSWTPATSIRSLGRAATVVRATYLHPYQMHGSIGTSCAVADVKSRSRHDLVADAVGLSGAQHRGDAARPAARAACASIYVRGSRLLRHQRRRHRVVRRGGPVAGRGPAGARAAVAAGRDGVGELRLRLRDRSARGARRGGHDRRVGLRVVERRARRAARLRHARQRRHRYRCSASSRRRSRRAPSRRHQPRSTTAATPRRRTSPAASAARVAAPAR